MEKLFNIINIPLGFILDRISRIFGGNFAASVFVFTLIVNIVMIPLTVKSQKSAVGQLRVKPKLDALKAKYGDDQRKYTEATQELYQKEGVSMAGGCLPMLIRLPIMMSIYYLIRKPLEYLCRVPADVLSKVEKGLDGLGYTAKQILDGGDLLALQNAEKLGISEISKAARSLDFNFWGIDLTKTPKFNWDIINNFDITWLIPILALATAMLSSLISLAIQKKANPDAPNMAGMMLTMPLISLFIAFKVPCAVGFYWACSSLIAGILQAVVQSKYGPEKIIAKERAKELSKAYSDELARLNKK